MPPDFCIVCATHAGCIPRRDARTGDMDRNFGKTKESQPFFGGCNPLEKMRGTSREIAGGLHAGTTACGTRRSRSTAISIFAPAGRQQLEKTKKQLQLFQPSPRAGATDVQSALGARLVISIHARVGGRRQKSALREYPCYFNPRLPCGGRPILQIPFVAVY